MEEMAGSYGLAYSSLPPYEVLSTRWLSYDGILELKEVEDMVEVYYNSTTVHLYAESLRKRVCVPLFHVLFHGGSITGAAGWLGLATTGLPDMKSCLIL